MIWELIILDIRNFTVYYTIKTKNEQISLETKLNNWYLELHNKVLYLKYSNWIRTLGICSSVKYEIEIIKWLKPEV